MSLIGNTLSWDHVSLGGDTARAFLLFCHSVEGWFMQQCFIIAVTACISFKLFLSNTQSSQFQYKKQSKDTEDVTLDVARGLPLLLLQLALDPFEERSHPAIQKKSCLQQEQSKSLPFSYLVKTSGTPLRAHRFHSLLSLLEATPTNLYLKEEPWKKKINIFFTGELPNLFANDLSTTLPTTKKGVVGTP